MSEFFQEIEDQNPKDPLLAACCHSGCTVCVLDYPELLMNVPGSDDAARQLEMLAAVERALAESVTPTAG
jgi:hypothetical protein